MTQPSIETLAQANLINFLGETLETTVRSDLSVVLNEEQLMIVPSSALYLAASMRTIDSPVTSSQMDQKIVDTYKTIPPKARPALPIVRNGEVNETARRQAFVNLEQRAGSPFRGNFFVLGKMGRQVLTLFCRDISNQEYGVKKLYENNGMNTFSEPFLEMVVAQFKRRYDFRRRNAFSFSSASATKARRHGSVKEPSRGDVPATTRDTVYTPSEDVLAVAAQHLLDSSSGAVFSERSLEKALNISLADRPSVSQALSALRVRGYLHLRARGQSVEYVRTEKPKPKSKAESETP